MHRRPEKRPSRAKHAVAGVLAAAAAELSACAEPTFDPGVDKSDAGSASAGRVAVHTDALHLPPLLGTLSLSLGGVEIESDREPEAAARIPLSLPLGLMSPATITASDAPPATYGTVRLVALDALTITTITGNVLVLDFDTPAPITLRCAGPGTYLPAGGQIDLFVDLDLTELEETLGGLYPPALPLQTITDPDLLDDLLDAVVGGLSVSCGG